MMVKIIGLNCQGASSPNYIPALLREAKRWRVDALLLQELNVGAKQREKYIRAAAGVGYHAFFSCSASKAHRGGTAVMVRAEGSALAAREPRALVAEGVGDTLEGRVCAAEVWVQDEWRKLVSIYLPPGRAERAQLLHTLESSKGWCELFEGAIVQGDMNCVARPRVDEQRENNKIEAADLGTKLERLLSAWGLVDAHRLVNGEEAVDFTRHCDTIKRRLDRFYTQEYQAFWRWSKVQSEPDFFRASEHKSDHLAVLAEVEWAGARAPTRAERRIKVEVLQDAEVQEKVRTFIAAAYTEFPVAEHGHAKPWIVMKKAVAALLLEASKREKPSELTEARQERNFLYDVAKRKPPSAAMRQRLREADAEVERQEKAAKKSKPWWSYISTMADELGSKWFFRKFRAKTASPDIASLWKTEEWSDEPKRSGDTAGTDEEVADEARKYYKWLFKKKESKKSERMLQLLKDAPLPDRVAQQIDGDLSEDEFEQAVWRMAKGKSPGPDGLPAEFYQQFAVELEGKLWAAIDEGLKAGALHEDIRRGEIILLYKSGDAREIRNYRPITLLNVDYKIFSRVVTERMKVAVRHIVSPQQLGFVPGRLIQEGTHMLKLLQAALDETDEDGLIIACDFEKAFDRASWSYLHAAIDALGFGDGMKGILKTMYTHDAPPLRQVRCNGIRSETFAIASGVPQGCPTSPLVFLLVAEALTRAVASDEKLKGVVLGGHEHKITQFADDTQLILRGYKQMPRMWKILKEYEEATGMRANAKKFEGLRCGALRRKPVPLVPELGTAMIRWARPGEYVRILGIPYWESEGDYNVRDFWIEKYDKMKRVISRWKGVGSLTLVGRRMLANAMVCGRFRYYAQTLECPKDIVKAIGEDAQAVIWGKGQKFVEEELGTDLNGRRMMINEAQYLPQAEMGGGVIHWEGHVKALAGHWILRYLDASSGPWKQLLDLWLAREHEGRGAALTNIKISEITKSLTYRAGALPRFWTKAIEAIRELGVTPAEERTTTQEDAMAHPMWFSDQIKLKIHPLDKVFREKLELRTLRDMVHPGRGNMYRPEEIMPWVERKFRREGEYFKVSKGWYVHESEFTNRWVKYLLAVPQHLAFLAAGREVPRNEYRWPTRVMGRWGWKRGQGLGARSDGATEPVSIAKHQHGKGGLGATKGSKREKAQRKKEEKPLVAVVRGEGEEARVIYGKACGMGLQVYERDSKGVPHKTDERIHVLQSELRKTLWWRGGVVGIAEASWPHPERWRLADIDKPLDGIGVRDMTRAFARRVAKQPNCKRKWEGILGEVNWQGVGKRFKMGLVTPTDYGTHYKCIVHRQMRLRRGDDGDRCRMCGEEKETIDHMGECEQMRDVFTNLRLVDGGGKWNDRSLNLLGVKGRGVVKRGASAIHHMVWKHVIPELVRVDEKGVRFQGKAVQERAARRYEKREEAMEVTIQLHKQRCEAHGWKFDVGQYSQRLDGIAEVTEEGEIVRSEGLKQWLKRALGDESERREPSKMEPKEAKGEGPRATLYEHFIREGEGKKQRT